MWAVIENGGGAHESEAVWSFWTSQAGADMECARLNRDYRARHGDSKAWYFRVQSVPVECAERFGAANMVTTLQPEAVACLAFAALPIASPERLAAIQAACNRWSFKAIARKVEELVDRGYIEPLRHGTACGYLTEKGLTALAAARESRSHPPDIGSDVPGGGAI